MTTNNHSDREHAPFGGSVASRRINCTASYQMEKQLPPVPPSADADMGTEVHEAIEYALEAFLYFKVHGEFPDTAVPAVCVKHAEVAQEYVQAVWKYALNESITGKVYAIEKRLVISEELGMAGPADFVALYVDSRGRNIGIIGDYKNGYNYVEVKNNDQLYHYACGLREEVRRGGKDLHAVRAFIYQPNAGDEPYRETTFTSKQLDVWKKRALKAAETIFVTKKPKFKAGDWCKWCRAKAVCSTYAKSVTASTQLALVDHATIVLPKVEMMPVEQVSKIIRNMDKLEEFMKACKVYAMEACLNGDCLPGIKLVDGQGKRSWSDEEGAANSLKAMLVEPYTKKLIGITEATKELKKLKYKDETVTTLLAPFVTKSAPKILVEESDPRPAVVSSKGMLEAIKS